MKNLIRLLLLTSSAAWASVPEALTEDGVSLSNQLLPRHPDEAAPQRRQLLVPDEEPKDACEHWMAFAKDPGNDQAVKDARQMLNETVKDKNLYIVEMRNPKKQVVGWGDLTLEGDALEKVKKDSGISEVYCDRAESHAAVPRMEKRAPSQSWKKVETEAKDLRMHSLPKDMNLDDTKDYVRDSRDGRGSVIYIIEWGVQTQVKNEKDETEFGSRIIQKQTPAAKAKNRQVNEDLDRINGHGTMVASKAAGKLWGVAKEANIVSIQAEPYLVSDYYEAFEQILEDINDEDTPGGPGESVILSCVSDGNQFDGNFDSDLATSWADWIEAFAEMGVPIVYASGSRARWGENWKKINLLPMALFNKDTHPIINVGAANLDGSENDSTQNGDLLTIYGPGSEVKTQNAIDKSTQTKEGTSMAAPHAAGLIANYLAYSPRPWTKPGEPEQEGIKRVQAIREYLLSDASSYERVAGIRTIWNGATKDIHDGARRDSCDGNNRKRGECDNGPPVRCYKASDTKKYITRDTASTLINDNFCKKFDDPALIGGGKFTDLYLKDTAEAIWITIEGDAGLQRPDSDTCRRNMAHLLDGCDQPGDDNPLNWKGGAEWEFDGWLYSLKPDAERPSLMKEPSAWCKVTGDSIEIWGAGWENSGFGIELKNFFDFNGLANTQGWTFDYELLDGHEWRAFIPGPFRGDMEQSVKNSLSVISKHNFEGVDCEN